MEKKTYILCPRCELNYMDSREKYCDVCKAELGIGEANFLLPEEEDESEGKLCPICHTNYCEEGEDMCIECKKERAAKEKDEESESWNDDEEVAADIDEDMDDMSLGELDEEDEEEEEEQEEEADTPSEDDFEYINPDDFSDDGDDDDNDDDGFNSDL